MNNEENFGESIGKLPFFVVLLFCLGFLTAVHASAEDPLEKVFQDYHVSSVDDFLSRPEVVEAYFKACELFYGKPYFPRPAYDAILNQLRAIAERPDSANFKNRLWETTDLGTAFSISVPTKGFGRWVNPVLWRNFRYRWMEKLRRESAEGDPGVAGAASEILAYLQSSPGLALLGEDSDGESILNGFRRLRENLEDISPNARASSLLRNARRLIPAVNDLLKDRLLFPESFRMTTKGKKDIVGAVAESSLYQFQPISRRFHSIMSGIRLKSCVAGDLCYEGGKHLTPEAWAVNALKESQLVNVIRNGSYVGYIQTVPLLNRKDGKIYGSFILGSPELTRSLIFRAASSRWQTRKLLSLWFEKASEHLPKHWSGLIKSDSFLFHNAGVLSTLFSSLEFLSGRRLGPATDFEHLDDTADYLAKVSPVSENEVNYPKGKTWLDATHPGVKEIYLIDSTPPGEFLSHPRRALDFFGSLPYEKRKHYLNLFPQRSIRELPFYQDLLAEHLRRLAEPHVPMGDVTTYTIDQMIALSHTPGHSELKSLYHEIIEFEKLGYNVKGRRLVRLAIALLNHPDLGELATNLLAKTDPSDSLSNTLISQHLQSGKASESTLKKLGSRNLPHLSLSGECHPALQVLKFSAEKGQENSAPKPAPQRS